MLPTGGGSSKITGVAVTADRMMVAPARPKGGQHNYQMFYIKPLNLTYFAISGQVHKRSLQIFVFTIKNICS
jgi:hypothetical protein